jgi:competence protein ComEC
VGSIGWKDDRPDLFPGVTVVAPRTDVPHAALVPALSLLAGIVLGVWADVPVTMALTVLLLALLMAATALRHGRSVFVVVSVGAGWLATGAVLGGHAEASARDPPLRRLQNPAGERPALVVGTLDEDAAETPNGIGLALRVREWTFDARRSDVGGHVLVTVTGRPDSKRLAAWTAGRTIRAPMWLHPPARYLDPGVPDDELTLARRGIALVGTIKSVALVEVCARGSPIDELAAAIRRQVRHAVRVTVGERSPRAAGVVIAILIGDRAGLDPADERRLQEAGTYHVIAISGGNIAILAGCLLIVARVLHLPFRLGLALAAAVLALYVPVAGGGSSVLRATLIAIMYLAARAIDQQSAPASTLAVSATLLLCVSPLALVDPSFLLTFGATIGIVVMVPGMVNAVAGAPPVRVATTMLAASLASEIALLPIGAGLFHRVTFAGLALNFLAIPLMAVAQIGGTIVVVLHLVAPAAAGQVAWVPQLAADWLIDSAGLLSWMPWVTWRVPTPSAWATTVYYASLVLWLGRRAWLPAAPPRVERAALALPTATVVAGLWILAAPGHRSAASTGTLAVTSLDVGQGDSTLVQVPGGGALLVDAGGLGGAARFDIGERVVAPAAWALGVRALDALVATHGDVDHVGGAPAAATMLRAGEIWEGVPAAGDPQLASLAQAAARAGVAWRTVQRGDLWRDHGATVRVLHPPLADWERRRVRNDDSIVLEVRFGQVSFVLVGDAGVPIEPAIAARVEPASIRVLKVGHHGSTTATSAAFLEAIRPAVAVISCGRRNRFGHPAPSVVRRLFASGAALFRTDEDGAVMMETDGRSLRVRTFRGQDVVFGARVMATPEPARGDPVNGLASAIQSWVSASWNRAPADRDDGDNDLEGHQGSHMRSSPGLP